MGITLDFAFDRTSSEPIDSSLVLSKAEMLAVNDNMMPDKYFAVCKDDGGFYIYDKSATPSAETGKFTELKGGGGEEGKTYTMDWDESTHELTLTDGTTPQSLELTGLQSELTPGDNISIVEDPYTGTTVISSTGGGGGAFVLDTANPCSYNELQGAINSAKVILIKHSGNIYPFVEKWESDENTKRYVNIASLQRQTAATGAMYFFFEAVIGDFDSPMTYSSNFAQPTGKPYTDSVTGNLTNLTTTEKTNLVGAVNELKSSVDALGEPFRVKEWNVTGLTTVIPTCTTDIANTSIDKFLYKITGQEATDYQIVGMVAYQVTDSSGNRINCWPVCQFTGQGQTELNVRFMCGGTTNQTAARIQGWVLLKHR